MWLAAKARADAEGVTMTEVIVLALRAYAAGLMTQRGGRQG